VSLPALPFNVFCNCELSIDRSLGPKALFSNSFSITLLSTLASRAHSEAADPGLKKDLFNMFAIYIYIYIDFNINQFDIHDI
jgi:hypothetical protein